MINDENIGNGLTNPFPDQKLEWVDFEAEMPYEVDRPSALTDDRGKATCVTSRIRSEQPASLDWLLKHPNKVMHRPVLDIDIPIKVVPSSTPGHSHLFIDIAMSWGDYEKLLWALAAAGIVEEGYVHASVRRGHTSVRLPHVRKPGASLPPARDAGEAPSFDVQVDALASRAGVVLDELHEAIRRAKDALPQVANSESG